MQTECLVEPDKFTGAVTEAVATDPSLNPAFTQIILLPCPIPYPLGEVFILNKKMLKKWKYMPTEYLIVGIKCLSGRVRGRCNGP